MARWTTLAEWVGPTPNQGGAMVEQRGVVVHIAEGTYLGTIAWQRNPSANVSSHFIVARDGRIAQMVDTDVAAWTQRTGNGRWLSIENEGFVPSALTQAQVRANAAILARANAVYRVPLQIATSPSGRGLGHHSMGAPDWGHAACPGPNIIAQKPAILALARQLAGGGGGGGDMAVDDDTWRLLHDGLRPGPNQTAGGGIPIAWLPRQFFELDNAVARLAADVAELKARPPVQSAPVDIDALVAALSPRLQAVAEAAVRSVLGSLDA